VPLTITVAGEAVRLFAERALLHERTGTLYVADLHWGKAATFRAASIPLPPGNTAADLARLTSVLQQSGACRLVILGDLLHARAAQREAATLEQLRHWRGQHPALEILLVRGNHDAHAGDPPADLAITCLDGPIADGPFVLSHAPLRPARGYGLSGHLHPSVRLHGPGRDTVRLPCFHLRREGAVLPAFGSFTGGVAIEESVGDRVYAIADGDVLPVRGSGGEP
jgi:DNA ligase-associated metallophosphoesterase